MSSPGSEATIVVQPESEADESKLANEMESALGEDIESYTTSLKSSVTKYKFENGRRYHAFKDGSYYLPNDEEETDRLNLLHRIVRLRCGGVLHFAPLPERPQRILDLGTGTGVWAIEMADAYPSADILGNDLSPIQPTFLPPNLRFEVDDIENDWIYSSRFDFIHARYLAGSVADWPKLLRQSFHFTKPGGWVEFQDFTLKFYSTSTTTTTTASREYLADCALARLTDEVIQGIKELGREPEPGPKLKDWIHDAGFVNVRHKALTLPVGTWRKQPMLKQVGALNLLQFLEGLEGITMRILTATQGYTADEVRIILEEARSELRDPKLRAQHDLHIVWAQKPEDLSTLSS